MSTWLIFAGLSALALAAMIWPLLRTGPEGADRAAFDRAIFKDQLAELERDAARGIIGKAEAEAARNEIARRIIAPPPPPVAPARRHAPYGAFFTALVVPAIALPLYLTGGSPGMEDVPQARRLAAAEDSGDMAAMIHKVEKAVAANPDDVQGWTVLAGVYANLGRFDDAAKAYANLIRIGPPSARLYADLGEALAFAKGGKLDDAARETFAKAAALDPKLPKTRFFLAMALKQDGKIPEAKAALAALLADAPADAPWRKVVEEQLAVGPDEADIAAAGEMKPEDRMAMIRSMVEGLEAKLKENGADQEGWARLIRSRTVLGEMDKARAAYDSARDALKDKPEALTRLAALARELGVAP